MADAPMPIAVDAFIPVAVMAVVGALAAGAVARTRPLLAFGILFLLASLSRATLETPLGTMRPEMPAIAVVAAVLLASHRYSISGVRGLTLVMTLAFGIYLAVWSLSSAFVAPDSAQSLRMVAWLSISMVGGVVAFALVRSRPVDAVEPLALAGAAMATVGIVVAAVFLVAGPAYNLGVQEPYVTAPGGPRVYGMAWEANLYASFLAMCAPFALEAARRPQRSAGFVMLALILVGFPLGVTRAAYIGLAAGALTYFAVRIAFERRAGDQPRLAAVGAGLLVVGIVASNFFLPTVLERGRSVGGSASSEVPSAAPHATPTAPFTPGPTPTLDPYSDTIAFRLERVPIALRDLPESPLIGFGAVSFGQRHPERHAGSGQDHIAIMAVAVLYESGIIGAAALAIGFIALLMLLWKTASGFGRLENGRGVGAAAAFLGSVVSILIAYQGNNALHLAINWLVIGAATALIVRASSVSRMQRGSVSSIALDDGQRRDPG